MIILGHPDIAYAPFYKTSTPEAISLTPPNATVVFDYAPALCGYCKENGVNFGVFVHHLKELMLSHALGAHWFILDKSICIQAQKIADTYLFDGKVLLVAHNEEDIEFAALHGIDGVVFESAIK